MPDPHRNAGKEKFFHTLIQHHQGIIAVLDEQLNVIFRSAYGEKSTGWTNEELTGVPNAFIEPDALDVVMNTYQEALANPDKTIPITNKMKHKDGRSLWLEGTVTNKLNDPDIEGIVVSLQDVTSQRLAENKLLQSKLRYQTLTETSPVGIFHTDSAGLTTYVNPRWCQITGVPAEKALGDDWLDAVHKEDRKGLALEWQQATRDNRTSNSEYRFVRPDGSIRWVLGQAVPEKGIGGEVIGYVGTTTDITDLTRARQESDNAKQAVTNQERRFRALIENSNDGLTILGADGSVQDISPSGEKIMGYSLAELKTKKGKELVYPDDDGLLQTTFKKVLANPRQAISIEYRHLLPDGSCRWLACTFKNLLEEPYLKGIVVNYHDITDKKNDELRLKKSEELYRRAEAMGRLGHWELDLKKNVLSCSDELFRIMGSDHATFAGHFEDWLALIHPDDKTAFIKTHEAALKGENADVVYRVITPSGQTRYVHALAKLVADDLGEHRYLSGTIQDITQQVIAQNQVINERNLSDSIINSLPGIFYLNTPDGRILRWNQNFEKVAQYTTREIAGMHPLDFFDEDEKKLLAQKIENVFVNGEDQVQASLVKKDGGKVPYFFTGKSIVYEGEPCLLGVGLDFSDRIAAQEKIKEATQQFRELAAHLQDIREEERIQIARDIHDDLGQQLTAVQIAMFRLAKQFRQDEAVEKQVQGISEMIGQVMQSIRRISTQLRPAVLDDIGLVEAMKWQTEEFEKRVSIPVSAGFAEVPDDLQQPIAVNLFRIYQETLTNIARHAEARNVQVRLTCDHRRIDLEVEDDGKGLDEELISSKRTLGLLGMKERALMIGGEFEFRSQPGKGTTIKITVPFHKNI